MANLSENPQWVDGIYQIETSDPVVGGPDGVSNRQAKELASRTRYLKKEQEKTGSDLATHAAAADPHTQYAPKDNPTFTGTPKAPTPATDSNSQQVATTAFVKSVVAALINGAPAALDTLQELAKSLGNDPSFSATVLNAIADVKTEAANKLNTHNSAADPHTQYAPKASPALTGKPTAPTAAQASNDTQVATTAFVKAAVAALVNGSPAALDTLQELANALGNDPNFSTTILNALSGKLAKDQNGADIADKNLFVKNIGAARAFHGAINIGGDNGAWKTSDFIAWLKSQGAFSHPYWVCKGGWYYAGNKIITDTGVGNIQLAGAVIEVFGTEAAMTIRITTPSTVTAAGAIPNSQFIYINHGDNYSPGWRRDYNTRNLPTAADVGALPTSGTAQAAAKLATPRTINGVPFDGSANIALTPANLGLSETVNLAAGALEKAKNGADISDKTAFYNNVTLRGTLSDGMTFANCDRTGEYVVAINDPNTISDMPVYKGQKLYGYGVLHVFQHGNFVGQEYINHSGDYAWRQKWDDGVNTPWIIALSSSRVPTAADVGAYTKAETDTRVATATTAAASANTNANGRVPSGRMVNGKALTADIILTADDVGAMPANSPGAKIWVSGEYTFATSTPIVVSHGLVNINPLHCRCDVLIKCITAEGEYRVGDFAINPMTLFMQSGVAHPYSLLPALSTSTIQLNMMHYLAASFKTSTIGNQQLNMTNWRCILRIFY
ncbi:hypothetical protein [Pectobacterium aquaticum]|uniref:hypothetical protein n=1 Tax=Pectobacterium aquaticum TaxID=2204145 RepID=UPI001D02DFB4|nr:hypothetical protein [Pectobacterium aquaticum]